MSELIQLDTMVRGWDELQKLNDTKPQTFFADMFSYNKGRDFYLTDNISFDEVTSKNNIAVTVSRMDDYNLNKLDSYQTKTYKPAYYREKYVLNRSELFRRLPGYNPFDTASQQFNNQLSSLFIQARDEINDKLSRAMEFQASKAILEAKIPDLTNSKTFIEFDRNPDHVVNEASPGTYDGYMEAFSSMFKKIKKATGRPAGKLIFGETQWMEFTREARNANAYDKIRYKDANIEITRQEDLGASYVGTIDCGAYNVDAYTYPAMYTVPTGLGLPNEGTDVEYMPVNSILAMGKAKERDFIKKHCGVPVIEVKNGVDAFVPGVNEFTNTMERLDHGEGFSFITSTSFLLLPAVPNMTVVSNFS